MIGKGSFCESGIERIVIPKSVEEIQDSAFEFCKSLKDVAFEAGSTLKKIDNFAFLGCTSLRNILFPDGLEAIGTNCFKSSGLEEVVLPVGVKSVGPWAF